MNDLLDSDILEIIGSEHEYRKIISTRIRSFKNLAEQAGPAMSTRILQSVEILETVDGAAKNLPTIRNIFSSHRPTNFSQFLNIAASQLLDSWKDGGLVDNTSNEFLGKTQEILLRYRENEHGKLQDWLSNGSLQIEVQQISV